MRKYVPLLAAFVVAMLIMLVMAGVAFSEGHFGTFTLEGFFMGMSAFIGGLTSLFSSLFWLVVFAAVVWGLLTLANSGKGVQVALLGGGAILVALLLYSVGILRISNPNGQFGNLFFLLVMSAILVALMWAILQRGVMASAMAKAKAKREERNSERAGPIAASTATGTPTAH